MNAIRSLILALLALTAGPLMSEPKYRLSQDWVARNSGTWQRVLEPLAGKPGLQLLEVGSFEGASTIWFLDHILTAPDAAGGRERGDG